MQVLEAHGTPSRRGLTWLILGGAVLLVAVVAGLLLTGGKGSPPKGKRGSGPTTVPVTHVPPLTIVSASPAAGAQNVASDSDISVTFSAPISLRSVQPTLSPAVAGTWEQSSPTTIHYDLAAPLVPSQTEVLTIPGGASGMTGTNGSELPSTTTIQFGVAIGDEMRLQEILAELDYLPLSFTPTGAAPAAKDLALPEVGNFAWRWTTLPANLTSLWIQGEANIITKAAVMSFENQHQMMADGIAGPAVWTALLSDLAARTTDPNPYNYVLVSKVLPETLTLYSDGTPQFTNVAVNTGAPGADTQDGTFAVFEHVKSSEMKGTNPDGTKYDDPDVPWASFFNGGDALHGFVRAHYGFPQSNGCVEMSIANAQLLWPHTPIGTLVTVIGPPPVGTPPTTTTTTTKPAAPPTTTTAPAPPPPATTTPTTAAAA
jgi:peptidoglycan hydrolase-like protein with peptidoglycan-binding domain